MAVAQLNCWFELGLNLLFLFFRQASQVWQAGHEHEINSNVFSDDKNKEPNDATNATPIGDDIEADKELDEEPGAVGGSEEGAVGGDPLEVGNEVTVAEDDHEEEDEEDDNEEEEDDDADAEADEYLNKLINKGGEVS